MSEISVRESFERHGTTAIANAMGLPISTIHEWKMADAIPSKGRLHELKVAAFLAAVEALDRQAADAAQEREAAARSGGAA